MQNDGEISDNFYLDDLSLVSLELVFWAHFTTNLNILWDTIPNENYKTILNIFHLSFIDFCCKLSIFCHNSLMFVIYDLQIRQTENNTQSFQNLINFLGSQLSFTYNLLANVNWVVWVIRDVKTFSGHCKYYLFFQRFVVAKWFCSKALHHKVFY